MNRSEELLVQIKKLSLLIKNRGLSLYDHKYYNQLKQLKKAELRGRDDMRKEIREWLKEWSESYTEEVFTSEIGNALRIIIGNMLKDFDEVFKWHPLTH